MACLVKGDFSRQASKIYADAAEKAAKAAEEYEASTRRGVRRPKPRKPGEVWKMLSTAKRN